MGAYNRAVITTAGQNLFASAIAGDSTVTFTRMQTSSRAYPASTDFAGMTALTDVQQTEAITSASAYGTNIVQVSARFDNAAVTTSYLVNTLGLFARLTGGSETLVAVITARTPDEMPVADPDSPSAFIFNVQIAIDNASAMDLTVDPAGTVNVGQLADYVTVLSLDVLITVDVATSGWTGTAPNISKTINAAVTADSVPFVSVMYPDGVTAAQKKAIDKSVCLLTKMSTADGSITLYAVDTPATPFTLALRGV
jgi:hypothetical protein